MLPALFLTCLISAAIASPVAQGHGQLRCRDFDIPVQASAYNKDLPQYLTIGSLAQDANATIQLVTNAPDKLVEGNYTIRARYCEPTKDIASRRNTLQLLVHGVTYSVNYWSGVAPPGQLPLPNQALYSYVQYAADQGYPTLSIDRLCNGNSSRPNGITFCQIPLETDAIYKIIQSAKKGTIPGIPTAFQKVVLVGHSYGSIIANYFAVQHPTTVDALLLTGYSLNVTNGASVVIPYSNFKPAAEVSPRRFGNLDKSYVQATNESGITFAFYYKTFSPDVAHYDFQTRGTLTVGEILSIFVTPTTAPKFRGDVFVLDGNNDIAFCSPATRPPTSGADANCSNGFTSLVRTAFPHARRFSFFDTPETGHCLNNHFTAQTSYRAAHDFLATSGF